MDMNLDATNLPLENMYTDFDKAMRLLRERRQDPVLMQKVKDFFGEHMLPELAGEPKIVHASQIASPNHEFDFFWENVWDFDLDILFFETNTKFVTNNLEKLQLLKLLFSKKAESIAQVASIQPTYKNIIVDDIDAWAGHPLFDAKTKRGDFVRDVHHSVLLEKYPELSSRACFGEFSLWLDLVRDLSEYKYLYYICLFVCSGILMVSFDDENIAEHGFLIERVITSFYKAQELFGVRPLIVSNVPREVGFEKYWYWYDSEIINLYGKFT